MSPPPSPPSMIFQGTSHTSASSESTMQVFGLVFLFLLLVPSLASKDSAPVPPAFVHLLTPPPLPMHYYSPPPPHHLHHRKSYPPPPLHYEAREPPPPMFYRSPPPPSPPYHHRHHAPPPCYPSKVSHSTSMKLVIQGRLLLKHQNMISRLQDARVKVECSSEDSVKESYGRTDAEGTFKVMVSGLELGKVNISRCGVEVDYKAVKSSHLAFKFISTKEIVLDAGDILLYSKA